MTHSFSSSPSFSRYAAALLLAALFLAPSAHADYLWIERDGEQAVVRAGELDKPLATLPALRDVRAVAPDGQSLPHTETNDRYAFVLPEEADARFTAVRAGSDGVLTWFAARSGRNGTKPVNALELAPTTPGGNTFQLFFQGRPVAAGRVNVETSEGWRRTLTSAEDGTVGFTPSFPGLYVLEVSARVNDGQVTLDGKTYRDVRHTATLSFTVRP
jgi:hypothetical protein